jgi:hypothetical protein
MFATKKLNIKKKNKHGKKCPTFPRMFAFKCAKTIIKLFILPFATQTIYLGKNLPPFSQIPKVPRKRE